MKKRIESGEFNREAMFLSVMRPIMKETRFQWLTIKIQPNYAEDSEQFKHYRTLMLKRFNKENNLRQLQRERTFTKIQRKVFM